MWKSLIFASSVADNRGSMENLKSLIEGCEELVEQFKYDDAIQRLSKVFEIDPVNQDALALKATCLMDQGCIEGARECLEKAIQEQPDSGFEKYLGLAQISEGLEGMKLLEKAESLLLDCSYSKTGKQEDEGTRMHILSSIACSKLEIWMTDLCMQEDAEAQCEKEIQKAFSYVPAEENWEALQCSSTLLLSQNKAEDALNCLDKSISIWRQIPLDSVEFPSFEFRLTTARLLVELGSIEAGRIVLEELTEEDDEIIEVWYLLSLCYYSLSKAAEARGQVEDLPSHEALCNAEFLLERNPSQVDLLEACKELREAIGLEGFEDGSAEMDNDDDDGSASNSSDADSTDSCSSSQ